MLKYRTTDYSCFVSKPSRTLVALLCLCVIKSVPAYADHSYAADAYLDAVRVFADNVLTLGRNHGKDSSPLFVDGINRDTHEAAAWVHAGQASAISNFANQQDLLRTLTALTALTGKATYADAARSATERMFEGYQHESGLLQWGGHRFIDLNTGEVRHEFDNGMHELKQHLPYYDLMWEVDPVATTTLIDAIWGAHIADWELLDLNRHGRYHRPSSMPPPQKFSPGETFFESENLSFINIATDLVHAGLFLARKGDRADALAWSLSLHEQYVRSRHPVTSLGVYQYSQPRKRAEAPTDPGHPRFTWSTYGDRAQRQFGQEFGEVALEGNLLTPGRGHTIYGRHALALLNAAEQMGDRAGEQLVSSTLEGMLAYSDFALDEVNQRLRPLWADGTDLTDYRIRRSGYFGREGTRFRAGSIRPTLFYSYALAYRISKDADLWPMIHAAAVSNGLGSFPDAPQGVSPSPSEVSSAEPEMVFGLLALHEAESTDGQYLLMARMVADNIIRERFDGRFFVSDKSYRYVRFATPEPLALLALSAAMSGRADLAPDYLSGNSYTHGDFDDHGRTTDNRVIWDRRR